MDKLNSNRAFTHRRSHAFDGSGADIANDEDAGDAGFQQKRIAFERPAFRWFTATQQRCAGADKAMVIHFDGPL